MSNSNRARGRRNRFHEMLLRVLTGVHAFCWSGAVERISVLPALSVLIFFPLYATAALGAEEVGGKLGPVLSRLADEYDRFGAEGAREFVALNELRARTSADGQLVSFILKPLREGNAAGIDRGGVREAGAVVDAVSRSYMRVLVPVERLRALSELPDISIARAPIPAIPVDTGRGPIVVESVELTGADDIQLTGFTGEGAKVSVVDIGFTGLDNAIAVVEIPAGTHRLKGNVEGVDIDGFTVHGVGVKVTPVDDGGNEGQPAAPVIGTDGECCEIPLRCNLHQNFPNPFNPVTTIKFDIRERVRVRLVVYNVSGQRVRVLMDGEVPPGSCEVVWNGRDDAGHGVASGIYFYRLESPGFIQSRKMILLK